MKLPSVGLWARASAAIALVTTTATVVMALSATKLQESDAIDGYTFAAKSMFGAVYLPAADTLAKFAAGRTDLTSVEHRLSPQSAEWMLFRRNDNGSIELLTYATELDAGRIERNPHPAHVADPYQVAASVADQVLVRIAEPSVVRTAITTDPESGKQILVVSAGVENCWVVQYFDLSPMQQNISGQRQQLLYLALAVAVLGIAASVLAARFVQRPVRQIASAARELGEGTFDVRVPVNGRDELADLAASFNAMAERVSGAITDLRAKDQQQQRFVADVAHDLRTPLASMVATVDALDTGRPETRARATQLLAAQTRRLARLVEDLMEISQFDAGSADFRLEPVDLPALVADAIELTVPDAAVRVRTEGELELVADPRRVHTIVRNLLANAVRHGQPPVEVSLVDSGDIVTIRVSDGGPGIPDELLPILFDRFVRGDQSRQATDGSGLGLSIARENALIHGGTLTAHNEHGAVFIVTLPRRADGRPD